MEQFATINQTVDDTTAPRKDIYQQVTDTIIKQLEQGVLPWRKPWNEKNRSDLRIPKNFVTGNLYHGINILLLWSAGKENNFGSNEWASYKQWATKNENIRKGEKGNLIVYSDSFEKEVEGELKKIPFLKYSVVFNRCQLASYDPQQNENIEVVKTEFEQNERADDFVNNTFAEINHGFRDASYNPTTDIIKMPDKSLFYSIDNCTASESYYSTLFHELTHWTGHLKRLNRQIKNKFGNHAYAQEELVAELGAAFLFSELEMSRSKEDNHAAYIADWLTVLKDNKYFIISAASEASKAVEYMKDLQPLKL